MAAGARNQKLAGIRFFYEHVLGGGDFELRVPAKRSGRLPEPLSRGEIARFIEGTTNLKHRVLLMTAYAAGLRVSELVRLKPRDIHSDWLRGLLGVDPTSCPRCGDRLHRAALLPSPSGLRCPHATLALRPPNHPEPWDSS